MITRRLLVTRMSAALLLAAGLALTSFGPEAHAADASAGTPRVPGWYQWRGPEQNGTSRETGLVDSWDPDTGENVIWAAPVGGMSSPVVWNNKVYTWTRIGEVPAGSADYPTLAPGPK